MPGLRREPLQLPDDGRQAGLLTPDPGESVVGIVHVRGFGPLQQADRLQVLLATSEARTPCGRIDFVQDEAEPERVGFVTFVNASRLPPGPARLELQVDGDTVERREVFVPDSPAHAVFEAAWLELDDDESAARLEALRPILRCPSCHSVAFDAERTTSQDPQRGVLTCGHCGVDMPTRAHKPLMTGRDLDLPIDFNVLENSLDPRMLEELATVFARGGRALDLGCGRRGFGLPGLVQIEVSSYPFADVVNDVEELPFADASFDLVFCAAVTEHVPRPWVLAQEIERVAADGALVIVDSAFLQPYHAYPDHYFNMSDSALRRLFPQVEAEFCEPLEHQSPWHSLLLQLTRLAAELPAEDVTRIQGMTLGKLFVELGATCAGRPSELDGIAFPTPLTRALAAGFTLRGRRRRR